MEGAAFGATGGAFVGGLTGLVVGLGLLTVPGVGPVLAAGSIAAALGGTLVGAGVGAAAGGLLGALVGAGIPKQEAEIYTESIRRGGTLVLATVDDAEVERVRAIMNRHNAVDIEERGRQYHQERERGAADEARAGRESHPAEHGTIAAEQLDDHRAAHDPVRAAQTVADGLVAPAPGTTPRPATDETRAADAMARETADRPAERADHAAPDAPGHWERSSKTGTVAGAMTGAAAGGVAGIAGGPVGAAIGMAAGAATGAALGAAADASGEKADEERRADAAEDTSPPDR